jgi:DNA polymerase-3 subunit epsilon
MEVPHYAAVVDVETTGLSPYQDEIIELSIELFSFDPNTAQVLSVVDSYCGQREPATAINPAAAAVHGLSMESLRGKRLDEQAVRSLLKQAEFLIAHNAPFDRGFVLQVFPDIVDKPWLCSMHDVDWRAEGCETRRLGTLLERFEIDCTQLHRASLDTAAVIALLLQRGQDQRPFFAQLLDKLAEKQLGAKERNSALIERTRSVRPDIPERRSSEAERCARAFTPTEMEEKAGDFLTQPPPRILFRGKTFVLTGGFAYGRKSQCDAAIRELGGCCAETLTLSADYLVVGSLGDRSWSHGSYGTKIEKARQYACAGYPIAIISEDHWAHEMQRTAESAASR